MRRTAPRSRHPFLALALLSLTACAQEVGPLDARGGPERSVTCAPVQELSCPTDRPRLYELRTDLGFGEAPAATLQAKASEAEVTYVGRSSVTAALRLPSERRGNPLFLVVLGVVPLALVAGLLLARSSTPRLRAMGRRLLGGTVMLGGAALIVGGLSASPSLVLDNASAQPATILVQGRSVALPPMSHTRVSVAYPAVLETQVGGVPYETVVVEDPFSFARRWRRLGSKEAAFVYSVGGQASYSLKVARYTKR